MTVIRGRILIVSLSFALRASNTMVLGELAVSIPLTLLWMRPEPHQEKGSYTIWKGFSLRLYNCYIFSPLFSLFFFSVLKITLPPLERFSLSHALFTPSFPDPLFTFLFTRYTIWVVFKQIWTFTLFWFYLWSEKQSTLTWNRHCIAYGGNLQSTDAWKVPKRKQSPAVLPCL